MVVGTLPVPIDREVGQVGDPAWYHFTSRWAFHTTDLSAEE